MSRRIIGKHRVPVLLLAMMVAFGLTGCSSGGGGGGDSGTLNVALVPATVSALPLLADGHGEFENQGLHVKITQSQNLASFAPGLGRQYDIAWGTPADVVAAAAQGHDIVAIAGAYEDNEQNQQAQIFASKESGVTSIADLKGKRIATPTLAGTLYLSLVAALASDGLGVNDVHLVEVPFPNMLDQLNAGRVDAAEVVQPFVGQMKAAGAVALGDPFLKIASPTVAGMWIADRSWAESHKSDVEKFVAALDATQDWVASDESAARTLMAKELNLPTEVAKQVPLPSWGSEISARDLEPWITAFGKSDQVKGDLPNADQLVLK